MSFLEHLEELRWHIIRSMIAIFLIGVVIFILPDIVFGQIIFGPMREDFLTYRAMCWLSYQIGLDDALCVGAITYKVVSTEMMAQFLVHIKSSFIIGLVIASPYVFWEIWKFIKPALYEKEAKYATGVVLVCSFLFIIGVLFGYFILAPFSLNFLGSYQVDESVQNIPKLSSYFDIISMVTLAAGIMFELPLAVFFLSKLGLVTPTFLRKNRKYALLIILIFSAIITPPDVTSQVFIALPVFVLYEISIFISARVIKKEKQKK